MTHRIEHAVGSLLNQQRNVVILPTMAGSSRSGEEGDGAAEGRAFGDEAGARSDLALARIRGGGLGGAWEALTPVLDLPPTKRIGGIVASLSRVHNSLRTPAVVASPLARNLREEIEAFARTPDAALTA